MDTKKLRKRYAALMLIAALAVALTAVGVALGSTILALSGTSVSTGVLQGAGIGGGIVAFIAALITFAAYDNFNGTLKSIEEQNAAEAERDSKQLQSDLSAARARNLDLEAIVTMQQSLIEGLRDQVMLLSERPMGTED